MVFLLTILWSVMATIHAKDNGDVEVRIVAEIQKNGYTGESFTYTVRLISSSPDISEVRILKAPEFPKDVKMIRGVVRDYNPTPVKEKGKTYYSRTIIRNYFIPDTPGKFTVSEGQYVAFIPHVREIYQGFWGNRNIVEYEEMRLSSNSVSFKATALPASARDKEYSGCVGDFNIEGWFPPGKIYEGKEAYVVFKISGYGSLENLKLPNIYKIFSSGCHLKAIEQDDQQMQRDGRLFSEVTLTCRFMPERDDFEIDPLCIQFFNPEQKKYYDACSEALHWTQAPAKGKQAESTKDAIAV